MLELGSGSGLAGIAVTKLLEPSQYTFTDCHGLVLQRIKGNVAINFTSNANLLVEQLDWEAADEAKFLELSPDTIIASGKRRSELDHSS